MHGSFRGGGELAQILEVQCSKIGRGQFMHHQWGDAHTLARMGQFLRIVGHLLDQLGCMCESRGVEEATTRGTHQEHEGEEGDGLAPMQNTGAAPALPSGEGNLPSGGGEQRPRRQQGRNLQMKREPLWQRVKPTKHGMLYAASVLTPRKNPFRCVRPHPGNCGGQWTC